MTLQAVDWERLWRWLDEADAASREVAGGEAAALATAAGAGLPVLPGFVLTTAVCRCVDAGETVEQCCRRVRSVWGRLSQEGAVPLVVRSSLPDEDGVESSRAGRIASVFDVRGWAGFSRAVHRVLDFRGQDAESSARAPIAVLVQPWLDARAGGVLFGADPVDGRSDRLVVAAVAGQPDLLGAGRATATEYRLTPRGRVVRADPGADGVRLSSRQLRMLADLAARAADLLGGPQEVEWAIDHRSRMWLLLSRAVTTEVRGVPVGPVLGAGPFVEMFPRRLARLEEDLWVPPLAEAVRYSLRFTGAAGPRRIGRSPVVTTVEGVVVADLELLGEHRSAAGALRWLDPRAAARRAGAAWRVGRLRAALLRLATDVVLACDRALAELPALSELTDAQLCGLLDRTCSALIPLHTHEMLLRMLGPPGSTTLSSGGVATRESTAGRAARMTDDDILARHPAVLAVAAPWIDKPDALPSGHPLSERAAEPAPPEPFALLREVLRRRVRWLHEVTAQVADELGVRMADRGLLSDAAAVRDVPLADLTSTDGGPVTVHPRDADADEAALPARFRLSDLGRPIPVRTGSQGAGVFGGRAT